MKLDSLWKVFTLHESSSRSMFILSMKLWVWNVVQTKYIKYGGQELEGEEQPKGLTSWIKLQNECNTKFDLHSFATSMIIKTPMRVSQNHMLELYSHTWNVFETDTYNCEQCNYQHACLGKCVSFRRVYSKHVSVPVRTQQKSECV